MKKNRSQIYQGIECLVFRCSLHFQRRHLKTNRAFYFNYFCFVIIFFIRISAFVTIKLIGSYRRFCVIQSINLPFISIDHMKMYYALSIAYYCLLPIAYMRFVMLCNVIYYFFFFFICFGSFYPSVRGCEMFLKNATITKWRESKQKRSQNACQFPIWEIVLTITIQSLILPF